MIIAQMYVWWYLSGWARVVKGLGTKLSNAMDFFSLGLLLKTLFEPFKQISAGEAAPGAQMQAFFDRLFSRVIGAVVRIGLLLVGILVVLVELTLGLALIIIWPVIPFLPLVGLVMTIGGVTL